MGKVGYDKICFALVSRFSGKEAHLLHLADEHLMVLRIFKLSLIMAPLALHIFLAIG